MNHCTLYTCHWTTSTTLYCKGVYTIPNTEEDIINIACMGMSRIWASWEGIDHKTCFTWGTPQTMVLRNGVHMWVMCGWLDSTYCSHHTQLVQLMEGQNSFVNNRLYMYIVVCTHVVQCIHKWEVSKTIRCRYLSCDIRCAGEMICVTEQFSRGNFCDNDNN